MPNFKKILDPRLIIQQTGQQHKIFTSDKVLVDIKWYHSQTFINLKLCLGGMHFLMSFVGCVGNLMCNIGLEVILKATLQGCLRCLQGKNFPMNVRAIRFCRRRTSFRTCWQHLIVLMI